MNSILVFLILGISISLFLINDVSAYRDSNVSLWINQVNEYSNYVHFQPEWESYPRNLIVDVSTSWQRHIIPGEEQDISNPGAKERQNTLHYVNGKPLVLVQYDYLECQSQWFHYAKTGIDYLGSQFDMFEAKSIPNISYSDELQQQKLENGFAQFVPICTSQENTNYEYTVKINDSSIGFDVYFVPSYIQQWNYFFYPEQFEHYTDDGCFANNYQKFTGICNVSNHAGLLIIIPDELTRPMTKISVNLTEQ